MKSMSRWCGKSVCNGYRSSEQKCIIGRSELQRVLCGVFVAGVKPPVLVTPLQDVESAEQGPAKFTAKITGFPEPVATW